MYFLQGEMERQGYADKEVVHTESYFPSSHRLALGHRQHANSIVRTAALSLAQGTDRFSFCWTLHDCEDYWGTQHYGCIGVIGRRPEYNPKPAAPAFATMTRLLDGITYDGVVETGSHSAFCLRFKAPDRLVYALWTIRGTRPIRLGAAEGTELRRVDENGNAFPLALEGGEAEVALSPTPVWVVARGGEIASARVGEPAYGAAPEGHVVSLEDFEGPAWSYSPDPYHRFAENHWDVRRVPGPMDSELVRSEERGSTVWRLRLTEAPAEKPFISWYGVFTPPEPVEIPGKARALGIRARGNSGWGRIVYELEDAEGESYLSCGTKDAWNCDDTHSWSYFNFDGWRYMEFPLPGSSPGDDYREKDSVWWGHTGDGVVDLPLRLVRVIVEMPTHLIYADRQVAVEELSVELDDLVAVYRDAEMATESPVELQRAARGAVRAESEGAALPNPIRRLREEGGLEAPEILGLRLPEQRRAGDRVHVRIRPMPQAAEYQVWVSAYPDGRGAQVMAGGAEPELLVSRLRPEVPLYLFATYKDAEGGQSRPSAARKTVLTDEFPMK
jgi:hypothetical protein